MSVKSLQGRRTTYATRIKLMKLKEQNTTVKQMSLEPILEGAECWWLTHRHTDTQTCRQVWFIPLADEPGVCR